GNGRKRWEQPSDEDDENEETLGLPAERHAGTPLVEAPGGRSRLRLVFRQVCRQNLRLVIPRTSDRRPLRAPASPPSRTSRCRPSRARRDYARAKSARSSSAVASLLRACGS